MQLPKIFSKITDKKNSAEPAEIILVSEGAKLEPLENTICEWSENFRHDKDLEFERAYEISHIDWSESLDGCLYKIHGKELEDIECMRGKTLENLNKDFELRKNKVGEKFLFHRHDIPTFDSGDREWDSDSYFAVFRDEQGIFAIKCNCGYKIPRIKIYFDLVKSYPDFEKFLELLI